MTSSHSSSVSQWYGHRDWPGGISYTEQPMRVAPSFGPKRFMAAL